MPQKTVAQRQALTRFSTRSADEAAQFVTTAFGSETRWETSTVNTDVSVTMDVASIGQLTLTRATLAGYAVSRTLTDCVQIVLPVQGHLTKRTQAEDLLICSGKNAASIARPGQRTTYIVPLGTGIILLVPIRNLIERAEFLTDTSFNAGFLGEIKGAMDLKDPVCGILARSMKVAISELFSINSLGFGNLAQSGYEELLLNLTVASVFPAVAKLVARPQADCGSDVVRKARDYIVEHSSEPIEIARIAASLGVSIRTLQVTFQRQYGFSPRDFVMECRLDNARNLLLNRATNTTVTTIAIDCGFSDLSHFSSKYRDKFGELPSETRRRAKG